MSEEQKNRFEQAGEEQEASLLGEFVFMLKQSRKYWMIPLLVILLVFGMLIILGGTGAAPFIYPFF